jgi:hypothetical protein
VANGVEEQGQQRKDAWGMLELIVREGYDGHLTYRSVAASLGKERPQDHSRPMAAAGDLLDAAACIEGVPALALIAVRNQDGEVNPDAWRELGPGRDAIINRSLNHTFTAEDYAKIRNGLESLAPRARVSAWKYLRKLYPGDLLYQRLVGDYSNRFLNAVDDIGTDVPLRILSSGYTYLRDQRVRDRVLERAKGLCEYCGKAGFLKNDGTKYLESHHVIALANEGEDRETNVVALCANDHREAHFGARKMQMETEMMEKLALLASRQNLSV